MTKWLKIICLVLSLAVFTGTLPAQSIYATLTGTVSDPAQAVVPNAKVSLKNKASGDIRNTVTNSEGYYTFAALPVGAYDLQAEAAGFISAKIEGISFTGGDLRKQDVALKVGSTSERIEVTSVADVLTPVESGEKSATLTTKQLQDFSVVGRSAAEFIKILPGFSISGTGTQNRASFTGETIGINGNGDGGNQSAMNGAFSVNGLPGGSLDITADGAHVSDPGCNCATPVNPNTDMIQEFKVQTSNFGAENQKGPAVVSSVAKSGGRDFHGGAYMYMRDYRLNANDWLNNAQGIDKNTGKMAAPRPENRYLFPGGNIGGPVLIPGTNFNKDRNKMFFFTGFEYYLQRLDTGLIRATVPTAGMRTGNFTDAEVSKLGKITTSGGAPQQINQTMYPGAIVPASQIDPGGKALTNMIPLPNADPNANGGYNYVKQEVFDQNSLQSMSRVDYTINDNTRLYVRYNLQAETQKFPIGLWWRNGQQTPYPTSILGKNRSYSTTASLTSAIGPTLTNEFVFGYTKIEFPNVFEDPDKIDRNKLGYPYKGLWKNGVAQMPAITGWGGELATVYNPGGFEVGGSRGLFADKWLPSVSDNVSKVWGTHTAKFGGFFEWIKNAQPANGMTNGQAAFATWGGNSSGSQYADLLTGRVADYTEASFNRLNAITYYQYEAFAQDSWKVNRRLTLEYGLRISHYQPWQDAEGFGYAVFDKAKYNPAAPASAYSGFSWNKRDPSVPNAAFPTRALYYAPRVGAAYDVFGTGKTVLRGGWGRYYYHSPQFTNSLDVTAGVQSRAVQNLTLKEVDALPSATGALTASSVDRYDDRTPSSDSYSVTISQRIPWSSLLEVAYVGNKSRDVLWGNNINAVPYGALLKPGVGNPNDAVYDNYRPIKSFQNLTEQTHGVYQNYNSMQITWLRTKGRYNINANYTYAKSLGITDIYDQFNLANNYGVMPNDRRQVFNIAYSIDAGNVIKSGNRFAKGLVNGWQISGITQMQSGVNLTGATGYNYNLDATGFQTVDGYNISPRSINGTESIPLRPILTCDPGANLGPKQYVNGACFKLPTVPGGNGPLASKPVYGPAFMNHDLGMFKNFQISESKKLQLRFNAYNFLNHPLDSFVGGNTTKLTWDATTGKINPYFGFASEKQGRRIVQVAVKYYF
ncbi:MAG: carboxypeptidase regulatory-like domain-containing protein [Bryobacterales bacterium]|nr:carboxypeptidase regulatory-like domain-containing protein [Bryobacterales bacterium]